MKTYLLFQNSAQSSYNFGTYKNSSRQLLCLSIMLSIFIFAPLSFTKVNAEGTKQIRPNVLDNGYLILDNVWSPFALYDCPDETRLKISICNPGEKVYLGFRQGNGDVKFRIKDLAGNTVFAEQNIPSSGAGFINSHSNAIVGPIPVGGALGYNPLVFVPPSTGDYYIEFSNQGERRDFELFDITVANSANKAIDGRIWSKSWMFSTRAFDNVFEGKMFIYADDGIVTSIDFNGMQPFVFVLSANKSGTQNTGNTIEDRKSTQGRKTYPQYKIFLNTPDETCYPTGSFGRLTKPVTITGCGKKRCINVSVDKAGDVEILLDLALPKGYQPNTRDRVLPATVKPGDNCIEWDSRDGLGNLLSVGESVPLEVNYFNGLTHMPLFDVEGNKNGYIVDLIKPTGNSRPRLFWDDTKIVPSTPPNNVNLTGCSSVTGCHTWLWAGSDNASTDYGNTNTINTWWYANIITADANYIIQDVAVDANVTNPPAAPNDTTVCANVANVKLFGGVFGANGGKWTGGTNNFAPNNTTLAAVYTPSAAERTNGKVKLFLTSNSVDDCPPVTDTMTINFTPTPLVNAGLDQNLCKGINTISLSGTVSNATGVIWSGGNGTFTPDAISQTTVYAPTATEQNNGVTLTLTSTGNGVCSAASDPVKITFFDGPTANLGKDTSICISSPTIALKPILTVATKGKWTGGNGIFAPDRNTVNATYTASATEVTNGTVVLTFTTTDNANCKAAKDNLTISFITGAKALAGADQNICANNAVVQLNGSIEGASQAKWTGGNGTFNPNNANVNAKYTPTAQEIASGSLKLFLETLGSKCAEGKDTMQITFTPAPTIKIGNDRTVCENNAATSLNAVITGATGAEWINGNGTFVPNKFSQTPSYTPSPAEINDKVVALIARTTGNGNCNPAADTLLVLIAPAPTVDITSNPSTACANNPRFVLKTTTTNAQSGSWSGGAGQITPDINATDITYIATAQEVANGSVKLIYSALKGGCNTVIDTINLTFTPTPIIDAGPNQIACINNPKVKLSGTISPLTPVIWSGGVGVFSAKSNIITDYTATTGETTTTLKLIVTTVPTNNCKPVKDSLTISFSPVPTVDAGLPPSVCDNSPVVQLAATKNAVAGGVVWSGGAGTFSPNVNNLNATYTPTANEVTANNVELTITTTANGNCSAVTDKVKINFTKGPKANAGTDITVCADNSVAKLNGSVTIATGGIWSGGKGTFAPTNNTLAASYTPTLSEIGDGKVTLTLTTDGNGNCNPHSDQVDVIIIPSPTANAGSDQVVCEQTTTVKLNGVVKNSTGGIWKSLGTGTFSPTAANVITDYRPSPTDITNGNTKLVLSTVGNDKCNVYTDTLLLTYTTTPKINAGPNETICSNDMPVKLKANGSTGRWVNGGGTFAPNRNALNATYTPTATEISNGTLFLTYTTDVQGACPSVSDNVTITIPKGPKVNAGANQIICANVNSISLAATVENATGLFWTSNGSGDFTTDNKLNNVKYKPSIADKAAGSIVFVVTSTGNNLCTQETDTVLITINPETKVDAGPDETLCADVKNINLNATTTSLNFEWKTSGTGQFLPNNKTITATYRPSNADTASGTVNLTLTSLATATCPVVIDNKVVTITKAPTANAGIDQNICADQKSVKLTGKVTNSISGKWSTIGKGTFSPNAALLNTDYFISQADTAAKKIVLVLTTEGNGTCNAVSDSLIINIAPQPILNVAKNLNICEDETAISLSGTVVHATSISWVSETNGTFAPSNSGLAVNYNISPQDLAKGLIAITATSSGNGLCKAITTKMIIDILPTPTVKVNQGQTICADAVNVQLQGTVTTAKGGVWTTSGSGKFLTDSTTLNAIYQPSAADTVSKNIVLTLTTTGNGLCKAKSAVTNLTISPLPIVLAGEDKIVCEDTTAISLNGKVFNATSGTWATTGSGSFFPNAQSLNAKYVPSNNDKLLGNVAFTLTTAGNNICKSTASSVKATILKAPKATIGDDTLACENIAFVPLKSTLTQGNNGRWSSSGTGKFTPDSLASNPRYIPSSIDRKGGTVILTYQANGLGTCKPIQLKQKIQLAPLPKINAGNDQKICESVNTISLKSTVSNSTIVNWTSLGSGVFTSPTDTLISNYLLSSADKKSPKIVFIATADGIGGCSNVTDTINIFITPLPTVSVSDNVSICADASTVSVKATVTNANGVIWKSNNNGVFSPSANDLNVAYAILPIDKTSGKAILTATTIGTAECAPVSDTTIITITPAPTVNAGNDQAICADAEFVDIKATRTVASGIKWTTNGNGTFTPSDTSLVAIYTPTTSDKESGAVILNVETTGNGTCLAVTDKKTITITPAPTLDAGPTQTVCPDVTSIPLNPTLKIATGIKWISEGSGSFTPTNATTFASYIPSAADVANGNVRLQALTTGNGLCNSITDDIVISFNTIAPISAGPDVTVCDTDIPVISLKGSGTTGIWSGGAGTFAPNNTTLNASYTPTLGEISNGKVILTITSSTSGSCAPTVDNVEITINKGPTVNPGNDQNLCVVANQVTLAGTVNGATGGKWETSGSGIFANKNSVNTTYTLSASDKKSTTFKLTLISTGNGICKEVKSAININIVDKSIANAGNDVTICEDAVAINLNGSFKNAASATWSALPSGGSFSNTTMTPTFNPSATDRTNGSVKIILTAVANAPCPNHTDTLLIKFTPIPTVVVNPNSEICADTNLINLNGVITIAKGGIWTTNGTGSFSPSATTLKNQYILSVNDKTLAKINFKLTSTENGTCLAQDRSFEVTIHAAPTVTTGSDIETCADKPVTNLTATTSNSNSITWSSKENGQFLPDNKSINTSYQFTPKDIKAGMATFVITAVGNPKCKPVQDVINVLVAPTPSAVVNAGFDQITCANNKNIKLNGIITVAKGGIWKTLGTGTFAPNNTNLTAQYIPSAADTTSKKVSIVLTTTGNGFCSPVTDTTVITLIPEPTIKVGTPLTICADSTQIALAGVFTNATAATWSTSGNGSFSPGILNPNVIYNVAVKDVEFGKVGVVYTTSDAEVCPPVSASQIITITPKPTIALPNNIEVCDNINSINLLAKITVAKGIFWNSLGTGDFDPNAQSLQLNYVPSAADIKTGAVKLIARTNINGNCKPAKDEVIITFIAAPTVFAGSDQLVCANNTPVKLLGDVANTSKTIWKTLGSGTFDNLNLLAATYTPSQQDQSAGKVDLVLSAVGSSECNSATDTVRITFQKLPTIAIKALKICPDDKSAQLGVDYQNATSGTWFTSGTGAFSPNAFADNAQYFPTESDKQQGKISIKFVANSGSICPNKEASADLVTVPQPRANAGPDQTICKGATTNLFAITNPNQTYRWEKNNVQIALTQSTKVTVADLTKYVLFTEDVNGCKTSDTMKVDVIVPPTFDLKKQFCLVEDLLVNSNPANIPAVNGLFQWALNNKNIDGEIKPIIFPRDAGKYKIVYSFESCFAKDTTLITDAPLLVTKDKFGCLLGQVALETSAIANAKYEWFLNGAIVGATNPLSVATKLDTNYYIVKVVDKLNCVSFDSARVIGLAKPLLNLSDIVGCTNEAITLKGKPTNYASLKNLNTSFAWSKNNVALAEKSDSLLTTGEGTYIVVVKIEVCTNSDTSKIKLNPAPKKSKMRSTEFCSEIDRRVVLDANNGEPTINYLWKISGAKTSKDTVAARGYYAVTISNQFNCKVVDSILVNDYCPPVVYLPNAITPNSNNGDSGYKVFGRNFKNFEILVFSRWGEVIFKSNDRTEVWDGTYRGNEMPIGVYPYLINYEGDSEKYKGPYRNEGTITIVR